MEYSDLDVHVREKIEKTISKIFSESYWEDFDSEKKAITIEHEEDDLEIRGKIFAVYRYVPINEDDEINNDEAWAEVNVFLPKTEAKATLFFEMKDL